MSGMHRLFARTRGLGNGSAAALAEATEAPCVEAGGYPWTDAGCLHANDLNQAVQGNPGAAPPARIAAYKRWMDTSSPIYAMARLWDGLQGLYTGAADPVNHLWLPPIGGGVTSMASAPTVDLGSVPETFIHITGTATITGFGTSLPIGSAKVLHFQAPAGAVLAFSSQMQIVGSAGQSVITQPGDLAIVIARSISWSVLYQPVTPAAGVSGPPGTGGINAVVAGTGLLGGGSTPTVTLALDHPVMLANGGTGIAAATPAAALAALGGAPLPVAVTVTSSSYTLAQANVGRVYVSFSGAVTITLNPAMMTNGQEIVIMDTGGSCNLSNTITVLPSGTAHINGQSSAILNTAYGRVRLIFNGTNYVVS